MINVVNNNDKISKMFVENVVFQLKCNMVLHLL